MSGLRANTADVSFDYEGALDLARQLWSLADLVDQTNRSRQSLAGAACVGFSGPCADQFTQRMAFEAANCAAVSQGLRDAANQCAETWKAAMDEENRRRYARQVDHIKAQRNILQTVWDHEFGFKYPPEPSPVVLPQPPAFVPTSDFVCVP